MALKELTQENFSSVVEKGYVMVDFFAVWCAPCRMLAPEMEKAAAHFEGKVIFAKVDIDQCDALAAEYAVSSVPTVILLKDGKEIQRFVGLRDFASIKAFVEKAIA